MKSMLHAIVFLAVSGFIFWSGCSGGKQVKQKDYGYLPIPVALDSAFQLDYNQSAMLESANITIRFRDVAEDSRCPVGVQCIWPGQARIDLAIKRPNGSREIIQLISKDGEPDLAIQSIGEYYIKLEKVEPVRTVEAEMWPSIYKITLTVSRNNENRQNSSQ